jgi:apolipoprotein N-acyltransferase
MTPLAETAMLAQGWRRFLMLLVAGAIGGLSVPPLYVLPALFVTMPLLVWALDGAERKRGWRLLFGPAFSIGFAYGLGYFLVAFHWLGAAFFVAGGPVMLALMPFAILALAALIALFWGIGSSLAHLLWSDGPWRIVTLATFLTMAEWARGHFFSGFPFDLIGYAFAANDEMAQLASVIGVYGLTALGLLLAMTPALIWPADERRLTRRLIPLFLSLVVIAGQIAYGHYRLNATVISKRPDVKLRIVQPMVLEQADWDTAKPADIITKLIDLSESKTGPNDPGLADIDQIVWPESSLPFFLSDYPDALSRISQMLPKNAFLLTGAPREEYDAATEGSSDAPPAFNSLIAVNHNGEIVASYDKSHLVPFGEYLPFPEFFGMLGLKQFVPGATGWQAGAGNRLMVVPNGPAFLALICYEAVFSGELGRYTDQAAYILNITNDAWFDGSIGLAQHADNAKLRAVEEGMPLIRVANSGITEVVDPLGRVTQSLPPEQIGVLDVVPPNRLDGTIFTRLGYWPLLVAVLLGLAIAAASARAGRRRRV